MKNIFIIFSFVLLSACGDDFSGLPDPDEKASGVEPDSFDFASATLVEADDNISIYSQVPANQTRYYYFSVRWYHAGNGTGDLASVSLISENGDTELSLLELSWYDGNQLSQANDNGNDTIIDFTTIDSSFPTNSEDDYTIYFTVKNDTEFEVSYQLQFVENP